MSTSEEVLIDSAVKLDGESLQSMRASQKKWFIAAMTAVTAYAFALGAASLQKESGGLIALFAMPLIVVAFQAGRLAGRVEVIQRVRSLNRR
jgi:hypothetical protein